MLTCPSPLLPTAPPVHLQPCTPPHGAEEPGAPRGQRRGPFVPRTANSQSPSSSTRKALRAPLSALSGRGSVITHRNALSYGSAGQKPKAVSLGEGQGVRKALPSGDSISCPGWGWGGSFLHLQSQTSPLPPLLLPSYPSGAASAPSFGPPSSNMVPTWRGQDTLAL